MLPRYMSSRTYPLLRRTTHLFVALLVFWVVPAANAQVANITYTLTVDLKNGLRSANSVAADSAGNIFVTDTGTDTLYKETPNPDGTYTPSTLSIGAGQPYSVAIDSANNLYVANNAQNVYKETPSGGGYSETVVAGGFTNASGVAVDAAGDVYVLDAGTSSVYLEKLSGSTYTRSTVVAGLNLSQGGAIAVDNAGNVYIAETANSRALKETLSNGTYTQSVIMESNTYQTVSPQGIAVDATGAVIIVNENYGIFKAVPNGAVYTTSPVTFGFDSGTFGGAGASIDSHGNLYLADIDRVWVAPANELAESSSAENFGSLNVGTTAPAQSATFTFDVGGTLAATPYAVSTQGDLTLDFQPAATQAANVCVTGRTYNRGDTCTVAATFTPTRPGVRYGAIALFAPSGTPIATSYLQGVGKSPQIVFSPGQPGDYGNSFAGIVAADSSNNVIYSGIGVGIALRSFNGAHPLEIVTPSFQTGYTGTNGYASTSSYGTPFGNGYVVDGAGNIVVAGGYTASTSFQGETSFTAFDLNPTIAVPTAPIQVNQTNYGNAFLAEVPFTSLTATPPYNNRPAVDGSGNLYFADDSGNRILEEQYIHGAYNKLLVVATALNNPGDVVVDADGAVYAADTGNNRIVKETANGDGTYTQTVVDSGFAYPPAGLAIDRIGNLYVSLLNNNSSNLSFILKETVANNSFAQSTLTLRGSAGVDVDSAGNIFAAQSSFAGSTAEYTIAGLDVVTPPSFIFAQTAVGSTSADSPQTVTVTNNGNASLSFGNIAITAGFTLSPNTTCLQGGSLAPGASCTLLINFIPTQSGVQNGTLTLTDNHLNTPGSTQVIKLNGQGTGTGTAAATLSPSTYSYGSVNVGSSATQDFTLTNTGTSAINIASIALPNTLFTVSNTSCGTSLAAGASCAYTVVFKPAAAGAQTTTLSVTDDAGIQSAMLTGSGVQTLAAQAALTPGAGNFSSITAGRTSPATIFTLTNAGNAALSIASFGISGANNSSFFLQGASTCGSSLGAGASCTIAVTFAPTSAGTFTATLSITDAVGTQTAALTGTATAAATAQAALTPATANFGNVTSGGSSALQNFTLTNAGSAALPISSVALSGAGAGSFAIATNACGSTLAAGSSCAIAVTFSPGNAGSLAATLSVTDTVGTQTSSMTGTGTAPAATVDFTVTATPASQSVSSGSSATYNVAVASTGGSFTQAVALTASGLPPGATATFSPASVTPGGSGAQSMLTIKTAVQQASSSGEPPWRPFTAPVLAIALLILPFRSRRRIFRGLACVLMLMGIAGTIAGCGGGFALPGSNPTTYTITVTGTSGLDTHSNTVTLTVQ